MTALDDVCARLLVDVTEGSMETATQLYVSVDCDPVLNLGIGTDAVGRSVTADSLFAVYCAAKPAAATAVGVLVDSDALRFDDPVGNVLPRLPQSLASLTLRELLNHRAGLHGLTLATYAATSLERRDDLVRSLVPQPNSEGAPTYAEVAPWHILDWVIKAVSGLSLRDVVAARVLGPLGLACELFPCGMNADQFHALRDRFAVNWWKSPGSSDPMLMERNSEFRCAESPAMGSTGSCQSLGRFYEALLRALRGESPPLSTALLQRMVGRDSHGFDRAMARRCGYGLGFMVSLSEHSFGACCGPRAFGHSGNAGMTFALCDPDPGVVIAAHFNARIDVDTSIAFRRPALIEHIYRSLGC